MGICFVIKILLKIELYENRRFSKVPENQDFQKPLNNKIISLVSCQFSRHMI